nr:hypothetical protein [Bacteroidota bacterium]
TWSVINGSGGSFENANDPNALFTGESCTLYELKWNVSTECHTNADTLSLEFDAIPTIAFAGQDTIIHTENLTISLNANTPIVGVGEWSVISGDGGTFADNNDPQTEFIGLSCMDYELGWSVSTDCHTNSDSVGIEFYAIPTNADAGEDIIINDENLIVTLNANTPVVGSGEWSILSGEGGSFSNVNNPNAEFTGEACTTYQLLWNISTACDTSTDTLLVDFYTLPTEAYAGEDQLGLPGSWTTLAANTPEIGEGLWSILQGEGGQVTTPNNPNSIFLGQVNEHYILEWSIATTCDTARDEVNVAFGFIPYNLPDTLIACHQDSLILDAGTGFENYLWSTGDTTQTLAVFQTGTYSVTVENSFSFTATDSTYVIIINAHIAQNDTTICMGDSVELEVQATNNFSLSFDGVDDYVVVNPFIRNANSDLTINVYAKGQGTMTCPKTPTYESYFSYNIDVNGNNIGFHLGEWASSHLWEVSNMGDLSLDYQFYSITLDDLGNGSTLAEVFLNGVSLGQYTYSYSIPSYSFMEIGRNIIEQNGMFDGVISEIQMWDGLLTLQEIQSYMSTPPKGNEPGLVGYWNFEEGTGTIAYDQTTNGNDGTINGATWSTDVPFGGNNSILWSTGDTTASITVSPAQTTTYWLQKTQNGVSCADSVTVTVMQPPTAGAGTDTTILYSGNYTLSGTATNQQSVLWTTSGDGTFDDATLLAATYTSGTNDITNGSATLTLTAFAFTPCGD